MSYNKVIMMGRLTRDPEIKETSGGTKVAEFGLAVDSGWGENKRTTFVDITAWSKQAEFVAKYFHKGDGIHIEGRLDLDTWEDKNGGGKRSKHRITSERITFPLGGKGKSDGASDGLSQKKWDAPKEDDLEDVPF